MPSLTHTLAVHVDSLVPKSLYINDAQRKRCALCLRRFHPFRRRHHCRLCGEVACHQCTLHVTLVLPGTATSLTRSCCRCADAKGRSLPIGEEAALEHWTSP
ncbi:hypothetical protein SPRG_04254 [Saprolegnia parasitica CBS 223.65]|uniref:FYVE-type domain-containing protein n=1 Tax=Saprolegnia parasitica (strain CBS 223.65) TaxID=695850 RepID=A0A067CPF0_SAPPC|nr:hypothetical protein SPRG_04254 [Saprolegnia parasitica CBS 223.65]KDO31115.1 hypothetical protein SPRG_04254 [Saprolegnia parasitica CBS 223.65]|eukprot:XP_012198244.1 hypothetical protein SPRG_04254 [Saprolegnia parasitica CBS 223.65]